MLVVYPSPLSLSLVFYLFPIMTLPSLTWVDRPVLSFLDFSFVICFFLLCWFVGVRICLDDDDDDDDGPLRLYYMCL